MTNLSDDVLETRLRETLRAVAEAPVISPGQMPTLSDARRPRVARRATTALVAAAIVVVFFVPLPSLSLFNRLTANPAVTSTRGNHSKTLPSVDLSATPAGWVPVAYGNAQISVPQLMQVFYPQGEPCASGDTMAEGPTTTMPTSGRICPREFATVIRLRLVSGRLGTRGEKSNIVNGLVVYHRPGDIFYAPSLGLEAVADSPYADSIMLHTLTYSPRALVLAGGPAPRVPASWSSVTFQGLAFSVPRSWPITRASLNSGIGYPCSSVPGVALQGPTPSVTLSTDQHRAVFHCGPPDVSQTPEDGVRVDAGYQTLSQLAEQGLRLTFSTHCLNLHGLTACPALSPAYSILVLKVTVPGQSKPVIVSIGLAGNGMIARTILYSLQAAPPSRTTCAHNDKTFPARVWTQLVINGYMVCPVTVKQVAPFSASEAVARDVRNGAIPSTLPPLLARVGSKHGGLVGQPRHSLYWVLIDMPQLASGTTQAPVLWWRLSKASASIWSTPTPGSGSRQRNGGLRS